MALYIEAGYELADLGTYVLAVVETGGGGFTGSPITLASGTRFLSSTAVAATGDFAGRVTGYTDLISEIKTALNAGTSGGAYTVTFDKTTERVTIAHTGGSVTAFSLTATTNGGLIGQISTKSGALSYAMDVTPDYWISGDVGFWADYHEQESDEDIGFTNRAQDGTPYGVAKDGTATFLDLTVPLEPRASVYTSHAAASDPWTWQKLFRHSRNVYPLAIDDGTLQHFVKLRRPAFRPLRRAADYVGHFDVRLESELLARI